MYKMVGGNKGVLRYDNTVGMEETLYETYAP